MKSLTMVLSFFFSLNSQATSVQIYECSFDEANASQGAQTWGKEEMISGFQIQTENNELYCVGYIAEKCHEVEVDEEFPQTNYLNYKIDLWHMRNVLIPKNPSSTDKFENIRILSNVTGLLEPYTCMKQ